jgi:hypothetical protein
MNNPDRRIPAEQRDPDRALRVLVRYSGTPKDTELANELLAHLRPLKRFAGVEVWTDDLIRPGDQTREAIDQAIQDADLALLLLSSDFLASDVLQDVEAPKLMGRYRSGSLRIIPVVLRSCVWEAHPWLAELHPLPKGAEPIASFDGDERDRVLTDVAWEITRLAGTSTPLGAVKRDGKATTVKQPDRSEPSAGSVGGHTYNINIHNSTIGGLGAGTGVNVTGTVAQGTAGSQSGAALRDGPDPHQALQAEPRQPSTQRERDVRSLHRLLTNIDLDAFDEFFDQAQSFLIPHRILHFLEGLRGVVGASKFHITDSVLRALVDEFVSSFVACFGFYRWFEARPLVRDYHFTVTRWEDRNEARKAQADFQAQVARARDAFDQLLSVVKEHYPEIDLVVTSAAARAEKAAFDERAEQVFGEKERG